MHSTKMCLLHLNQLLWIREAPGEEWVNCLAQGLNDRFLPCQLWDLIQQPFGYWHNTPTRHSHVLENNIHT